MPLAVEDIRDSTGRHQMVLEIVHVAGLPPRRGVAVGIVI
jgi:hypothetical protein